MASTKAKGAVATSGLALGLEHRRGERLAAFPAGPDYKLEGLIVALARLERGAQQRFTLCGRGNGAIQHEALAEHDEALLRPQIEVPEPELLVDLGNQPVDLT